jgi:hypothetical protein
MKGTVPIVYCNTEVITMATAILTEMCAFVPKIIATALCAIIVLVLW